MEGILLALYLTLRGFDYLLRTLNLRHLGRHGASLPPEFAGQVDPERLRRVSAYTVARSRLGLVESLCGDLLLVLFLFGGLLPLYDRALGRLGLPSVPAGVLFFLGLHLAQTLLDVPFSLCRNFRIESRFGFNTMSGALWLSDLLKSTALASLLLALLASGALALVGASPGGWWLWVWAFFALVTLALVYLSPVLIEPLFFTCAPLRREGLAEEVRALARKAGLEVDRVLQVDASRRSRHSNAYFTGIGRVKRIVLYDTLLEQMTDAEVLAIVAHEAGHWKKGHVRRSLLLSGAVSLACCYLAHRLLAWGGLAGLLGLGGLSLAAETVILFFLGSLVAFALTPLSSALARRDERQADRFAAELTGAPEALASALVKLARENLANLHPHPLYARFHYTHPPVVERVRALRGA